MRWAGRRCDERWRGYEVEVQSVRIGASSLKPDVWKSAPLSQTGKLGPGRRTAHANLARKLPPRLVPALLETLVFVNFRAPFTGRQFSLDETVLRCKTEVQTQGNLLAVPTPTKLYSIAGWIFPNNVPVCTAQGGGGSFKDSKIGNI